MVTDHRSLKPTFPRGRQAKLASTDICAILSSLQPWHQKMISAYLSSLLALSLWSKLSMTQLVGCEKVSCPLSSDKTQPQCSIGNVTTAAIGITNFATPLSITPFTWTLTTQDLPDSPKLFEHDFFLGTSRLVSLDSSNIQACALFFDGVSPNLKFPGTDAETDQGTCADALSQSCVDDLGQQAEKALSDLLTNAEGSDRAEVGTLCNGVNDALKDHAPSTCTVASNSQWGDVLARKLTGPGTVEPVEKDVCDPTTGQDFALRQVASHRLEAASRNLDDLARVLKGVTPILTIFWDSDEGAEPDITTNLSCLKTIGEAQGNTTTSGETENGAAVVAVEPWKYYAGVMLAATIAFLGSL